MVYKQQMACVSGEGSFDWALNDRGFLGIVIQQYYQYRHGILYNSSAITNWQFTSVMKKIINKA